jgi:hypothetical protein
MLIPGKDLLKTDHTLLRRQMESTSRQPNISVLRMAKPKGTGLSSLAPIPPSLRFVVPRFLSGHHILILPGRMESVQADLPCGGGYYTHQAEAKPEDY